MSYKNKKSDALARSVEWLSEHIMSDSPVRSFRFRKEDTSAYHFTLTWTPGQLVLTGDCGELTLTHYHAMSKFQEAISWATGPDFDYLLGKSSAKEVYDSDETLKQIMHFLNEEPINILLGSQTWDRDTHKLVRRKNGLLYELRDWRKTMAAWEKAGSPEDEEPEEKPVLDRFSERLSAYREDNDRWHVPDGWEAWFSAWKAFERDNFSDHPNMVLTAAGRREIKEWIESKCESEDGAANLCHEMGYDDYYGTRNYTWHAFFQIACIQHGCRMILEQLK